jgi:tetratricopeptide (TPR) repeat protein
MRIAAALIMVNVASASMLVAGSPSVVFPSLLDQYDRGEYATVGDSVDHLALTSDVLAAFEKDAGQWIDSHGAEQAPHRALVAATLALEIARAREPPNGMVWPLRTRAILWGAGVIETRGRERAGSPATLRSWYLASMAGLEMLEMRSILTGEVRGSLRDPLFRDLAALARQQGAGGYLGRMAAALPGELRVRLARLEMREHPSDVEGDMALGAPLWTFEYDALCPMTTNAKPQDAKARRAAIDTLSQLARDYAALANDVAVRAEATLRRGYLLVRMCEWSDALDVLERVRASTSDPFLLYLTQLFTGRAFELSGQRESAIAAYEAALLIRPHAWSASLLLATQAFLSDRPDDRARAYALGLDVGAGPAPDDPWWMYHLGDARLWPGFMADLRTALHP